jgi:transcriptional regulator with XRE-family HTH domain
MQISLNSRAHRELIEELIRLRKARDWTQRDLAKRLRRSQTYVAKIERFQKHIGLFEFVPYLQALEADPVEVFKKFVVRSS